MSFGTTVAESLTEAGFNVTDTYQYDFRSVDIEVNNGEDALTFGLQHDGTVTWHDFTHTTVIANIEDRPALVEAFKELLPLRDGALQDWIKSRPWVTEERCELSKRSTPF